MKLLSKQKLKTMVSTHISCEAKSAMASSAIEDHAAAGATKTVQYKVPEEFFKLKGQGSCVGNWIFTCQKCINKTVSASYSTRANLRAHVQRVHKQSLKKFNDLCAEADRRKLKRSLADDSEEKKNGMFEVDSPSVPPGFVRLYGN